MIRYFNVVVVYCLIWNRFRRIHLYFRLPLYHYGVFSSVLINEYFERFRSSKTSFGTLVERSEIIDYYNRQSLVLDDIIFSCQNTRLIGRLHVIKYFSLWQRQNLRSHFDFYAQISLLNVITESLTNYIFKSREVITTYLFRAHYPNCEVRRLVSASISAMLRAEQSFSFSTRVCSTRCVS